MFVGLSSILLITSAAAQSCPANQIASEAQIVLNNSAVVPASALPVPVAFQSDANLTFFRDVLGYSDDEIQQEVQDALQFFSERFGLDFSLTQPNELGQRFFQNATLQPLPPNSGANAILNRWILTGNTRSKCFPATIGGFRVSFSGEQILKGTYGGTEGIGVPNDRFLGYLFISISVSPPIVIRRQTPIPIRNEQTAVGGIELIVLFFELSHPTLGQGAEQGISQIERFTAADGTSFLRISATSVLTFPPNVLTFN